MMWQEDEGPEPVDDSYRWEKEYERSWELILENEDGTLRDNATLEDQRARRKRFAAQVQDGVRKGMIRYMCLVVDMSMSVKATDMKPNRMEVILKQACNFIRDYFDQNPVSHMAVVVLKNERGIPITEMSGNAQHHIDKLTADCRQNGADGYASLQNGLEASRIILERIPTYGNREILCIFNSLSTCDPGDIFVTMDALRKTNVRVMIASLSAELYVCKTICERTKGKAVVAMGEDHLADLLSEFSPPPPASTKSKASVPQMVRMGFPQRKSDVYPSLCSCHQKLQYGGYICPRCSAKVCTLPTQCNVCKLTLVLSPHLARSFHHLFPVPNYVEEKEPDSDGASASKERKEHCFSCLIPLPIDKGQLRLECPKCKELFCAACDELVHSTIHNCPGCENM